MSKPSYRVLDQDGDPQRIQGQTEWDKLGDAEDAAFTASNRFDEVLEVVDENGDVMRVVTPDHWDEQPQYIRDEERGFQRFDREWADREL